MNIHWVGIAVCYLRAAAGGGRRDQHRPAPGHELLGRCRGRRSSAAPLSDEPKQCHLAIIILSAVEGFLAFVVIILMYYIICC